MQHAERELNREQAWSCEYLTLTRLVAAGSERLRFRLLFLPNLKKRDRCCYCAHYSNANAQQNKKAVLAGKAQRQQSNGKRGKIAGERHKLEGRHGQGYQYANNSYSFRRDRRGQEMQAWLEETIDFLRYRCDFLSGFVELGPV